MLQFHRAGMATDYKELAAAHESFGKVLAARRQIVLFVLVLFGLGALTTFAAMFFLRDLGLRDQSHDQALGGAIGFGAGFVFYAGALVAFRKRERRFAEIRATIEEQIGHKGDESSGAPVAWGAKKKAGRAWWAVSLLLLVPLAGAALPILKDWVTASEAQKAANKAAGRWVSHSGLVTGPDGLPVAGATVRLDDVETKTDENGRFVFGRVTERFHRVLATKYSSSPGTPTLVSDRATHVELDAEFERRVDLHIRLVPAGSVRVRFVLSKPRATQKAFPRPEPTETFLLLPGSTATKFIEGGDVYIPSLMPGHYAVQYRSRLAIFDVKPGQQAEVEVPGD
jgi:hypothetical protein